MAEFRAAAKKMTYVDDSNPSSTQYGFAVDVNPERFIPFFWSNGGDVIAGDKLVFNTPAIRNVLRFFVDMRIKDKIIPPLEAQLQEGNVVPFMTGQIAMYMAGRYLVPELLSGTSIQWDVIPLPYFVKPAASLEGSQFGIPARAKNPKAGIVFMKFLAYEEGARIIADFGDTIPALSDLANSKDFLEWKGINNKAFLDQLQYASYIDLKKRPNGEKIMSRMGETIWNMFLGQESVEKGCEKIEKEIQAVDKE
jgi:ABC-type glycerol-3-phosphate transport system substrate-binding protein